MPSFSCRFIIDDVALLDVPYPLIDQNPNWSGFWNFGAPWNAGTVDPWVGGPYPLLTPFDQNVRIHNRTTSAYSIRYTA